MAKRLILLRREKHGKLLIYAYLNEQTRHTYSIGFFPKEQGWMILDSGVVPEGGWPHTPEPIAIPGKPGKVYGIFQTQAEALDCLERHDASLNDPIIGERNPGYRPQTVGYDD